VAHLDLAGRELGVDRALGAVAHRALDAHDELAAQVVGPIDDALHDAGAVAQVEEREVLAVLTAACDPAAQRHGAADVLRRELAAVVGAHHGPSRFRTWSTTSARGSASSSCVCRSRSFTTPCCCSSGPTTRARRAPDRSAALNCAFIDRWSKARSARTPAWRSSWVRSRATSPPV